MTVVPFLVVAAAGGTASLLVRGQRAWSTAIAMVALILLIATATAMSPTAAVELGGLQLAGSDWLRLYAVLGAVVGLLLLVVDLAAGHEPDVGGVIVLGLGAAVLALALTNPLVAVVAATTGGLVGVVVAAPVGAAARAAWVGVRELRALAVAGALAMVSTAWLARPLDDLVAVPAVFGLAYLAFALAVAIRFGAIPFHRWAARVADAAPGAALPLLMAWAPAAFAAVALVWIDESVAPLELPLRGERTLIAAIGAATVLLGLLAAWIQDDLEHVVGYTIASDAGFIVLALASFEPGVWEPSRTWLLVFVAARSAFAAFAVAIDGAFGTRRLPELAGWARRAPILAVSLVGIGVATVGWPGITAWQARGALADLALPGPLDRILALAPLASIAILGRILWIGLQPSGPVVLDGRSERPAWPVAPPRRPMLGLGGAERLVEHVSHGIAASLDVLWALPAALRRNRMPITSIAVLGLAGLAFAVADGGLGVPAAARAVPVVVEPSSAPGWPVSPAPSASPSPAETGGPESTPSPQISFTPVGGEPPLAPSGG